MEEILVVPATFFFFFLKGFVSVVLSFCDMDKDCFYSTVSTELYQSAINVKWLFYAKFQVSGVVGIYMPKSAFFKNVCWGVFCHKNVLFKDEHAVLESCWCVKKKKVCMQVSALD